MVLYPNNMNRQDFQDIVHEAQMDDTLKANINMDDLLNAVENNKNAHLDNKTLDDISKEKYDQLKALLMDRDSIRTLFQKLCDYRYIDEIYQLHRGKHVRWIRRTTPGTLTTGGIVVDIKFLDTGTHILVKNPLHRFIQYRFDDCITFQKMSEDEMLILAAYDSISKA